MGAILGGLAIAGAGAAMSYMGTAKNAAAVGAATGQNIEDEENLYETQSGLLSKLIKGKNRKLQNAGNIFDRFKSTGAFGNTGTLAKLRQAQEDFASLAAGDFSGFEAQLRKSMSDNLISVIGSGSPVGTFAGLAADTQFNYRKEGIAVAGGITELLSNETSKLLGAEFGIMDQKFQANYDLERQKVSNINNYRLQQASTEGVGLQAAGNAVQQIGSYASSYGMYSNQQERAQLAAQSAPRAIDINTGQPYQTSSPLSSLASYQPPRSSGSVSGYRIMTTPGGSEVPVPNLPEGYENMQPTLDGSVLPPLNLPTGPDVPWQDKWTDEYNSPFSEGSGYRRPNYSAALSSIGRKIVSA